VVIDPSLPPNDTTTGRSTSGSVIVTGSTNPGTYSLVSTLYSVYGGPDFISPDLYFVLANAPTDAVDPMSYIYFAGGLNTPTYSATGEINPTPVPDTAPLLATGLGVLGFMSYWRKRRMRLNLKDAHQLA
jgi:hypothetical protein